MINKASSLDEIAVPFILSPMEVLFHGRGSYPEGAIIGPNRWPHHDLLVARRGAITMDLADQRFDLEAGDALLIPPRTPFSGVGRTADGAIWVMHYRGYRTEDERLRARPGHPVIFRRGIRGSLAENLLSEITAVVASGLPDRYYLAALASALLARLAAGSVQTDPAHDERERLWPPEAKKTLPRRVADLARASGLCERHYRARFLQAFGESPRRYLQTLKATEARRLLRETRLPIKEIAERVGYADVVAFHRAFTATNACTPGNFRREAPPVA